MAHVSMNIHDASWSQYRQIAVPETEGGGHYWKTWATESLSITVHRPDGPDSGDDA